MKGLKIENLSNELQDNKCKQTTTNEHAKANSGIGDQVSTNVKTIDSAEIINATTATATGPPAAAAATAATNAAAAANAENLDEMLVEYNDSEWETIIELKGLYLNTLENDIELQDAAHELEKSMEPQFNAIYGERAKLLAELRREQSASSLARFWLIVLKNAFPELITKEDAPILAHLIDLRSTIYLEPDNKFTIEFVFEPNEYFANEVLSKTYYLETMPNSEDPFSYNGAQVIGCHGCDIDWKSNYAQVINEWYSFSFFDFFEPPSVPSDPDDVRFEHILRVLEKDYECGYYLKSCVIPKAVLFFTGELGNVSNLNCDSDSNETLCEVSDLSMGGDGGEDYGGAKKNTNKRKVSKSKANNAVEQLKEKEKTTTAYENVDADADGDGDGADNDNNNNNNDVDVDDGVACDDEHDDDDDDDGGAEFGDTANTLLTPVDDKLNIKNSTLRNEQ